MMDNVGISVSNLESGDYQVSGIIVCNEPYILTINGVDTEINELNKNIYYTFNDGDFSISMNNANYQYIMIVLTRWN